MRTPQINMTKYYLAVALLLCVSCSAQTLTSRAGHADVFPLPPNALGQWSNTAAEFRLVNNGDVPIAITALLPDSHLSLRTGGTCGAVIGRVLQPGAGCTLKWLWLAGQLGANFLPVTVVYKSDVGPAYNLTVYGFGYAMPTL